ncbi:origin of replication complex subunit 6 isoform X5 [Gossypium hirsutum]|uniref:Origin of replication complex subunit 6 isoform X5 n=1 Tax=Gossypium hirsutum TaxID=3635 RepID=A0ABM3C207_GOSHI|nr:origin of replication complex subunit 6-like isoform X5 [Gossypium hirsutum]
MVSSIEFSYKTFSRASPSSRTKLDIRELGIQFGCVRLIPFVKKGLSLYKDRFLASLPSSKQASADFTRPVFTAVVFYLCAKKHKLKIDKVRLIEVCGTSESEFSCVSTSMKDLCHDVFEISSEKKDPKEVKGNRAFKLQASKENGESWL